MKKIRVAIVDDHAVVRMGMKYALSVFKDLEFVGEHPDGTHAAEFVDKVKPDVLLLDIRMPGKDGVAALEDILAANPAQKVMMLTTAGTEEEVFRSLSLGAKGYVMKDSAPGGIVDAIRVIAAGGEYVPEEIRELYNARRASPELTPRELEALTLLSKGLSNREIAAGLGVSEDGAKIHLKHVNEKLGAKDRVDAVAIAIRRGLVRPQ
ncbi:MAG: response regulator transcription factor [Kiritimatiellae bacterium]|nr:response regulator transcription factor [Kiritimatiellia bacterium]